MRTVGRRTPTQISGLPGSSVRCRRAKTQSMLGEAGAADGWRADAYHAGAELRGGGEVAGIPRCLSRLVAAGAKSQRTWLRGRKGRRECVPRSRLPVPCVCTFAHTVSKGALHLAPAVCDVGCQYTYRLGQVHEEHHRHGTYRISTVRQYKERGRTCTSRQGRDLHCIVRNRQQSLVGARLAYAGQ